MSSHKLTLGPWLVVNDDVMGGKSVATLTEGPDGIRFHGELSLENNGGFSSARSRMSELGPGFIAVRFKASGDGRRYQLTMRQGRDADGVSWRAAFKASPGWNSIELPLERFEPVFRGRPVTAQRPLEPQRIRHIGLLISGGQEGIFELKIRDLEFVSNCRD